MVRFKMYAEYEDGMKNHSYIQRLIVMKLKAYVCVILQMKKKIMVDVPIIHVSILWKRMDIGYMENGLMDMMKKEGCIIKSDNERSIRKREECI